MVYEKHQNDKYACMCCLKTCIITTKIEYDGLTMFAVGSTDILLTETQSSVYYSYAVYKIM